MRKIIHQWNTWAFIEVLPWNVNNCSFHRLYVIKQELNRKEKQNEIAGKHVSNIFLKAPMKSIYICVDYI